ncbi:efflux RND transporter periplasmic adaptor subunit [Aquincola sp. S2]|uniref:Efflux RND transporter periplasmic adaptor subunit n=1 Tax=Pseudaquabacterium terrae TaxID=2732868 RepID=A0ABX2EJ97_9BURK|nr:efflux RND transporter periplasmic adaptor subunit [Aquabacterium terrae]NRF68634.1 efflux RND transporter periplasmic adaptor subunit [Aquabacterium terrae]
MRTPRLASLSVILLAALLAACSKTPPPEEPVRAVRTMTVQTAPVAGSHEYAAEIRARTESRLAFRVNGKLVKRLVNAGDSVKAGQPLAQIDAQDLRLSQDAAQASLAAARANLEWSEVEFKRYKELREQGFISGAELDRREASLKAARAQADQVRAQAGVQTNQAGYALLSADTAGVITGVDAEPGAVVSAGTPVLRLAHDGPRDVVFSVPEDRVASVRALLGKRDALKVRLWGQEGALGATVREMAAAADPTTRTFLVKADVGAAAAVRLGQTANVTIESPAVDGLIRLPLAAVFEQQGKSTVWTLDRESMTVRARPVQVAGADGNLVVIGGGLQAGERVITAGVHALMPGQRVRLYDEPGSASTPRAIASAEAVPVSTTAIAKR